MVRPDAAARCMVRPGAAARRRGPAPRPGAAARQPDFPLPATTAGFSPAGPGRRIFPRRPGPAGENPAVGAVAGPQVKVTRFTLFKPRQAMG